jgi:antitoxin MazE
MRASIRRVGNLAGIMLPKPVLAELGLAVGDDLSVFLEKGRVVVMPAQAHPRRAGWAEAAAAIAAAGDDQLVWPACGNGGDDQLEW